MVQVNKNSPEVIITGAGPSGLMMACQLALHNIRFRIIDKKEAPSNHSGAMVVHARTLEIFQQMGLAEKMLDQGTIVNGISVYFNGKKSDSLNLNGIGSSLTKFPFILLLEQSKTERLLLEFLQQKGFQVEWKTELVNIVQNEHKVEAKIILPDGNPEEISTNYLIAADGGKSTIRSLLKIPFKGKSHHTTLSVIECESDILSPPDEILFSFSQKATAGFFPLPKGKWRIDVVIRRFRADGLLSFNAVQKVFNRKTRLNANIRNADRFSVFRSHGMYALIYRIHRCFLIGDAAHLFTPVGGQGMNTGLQDAHNLAWKMAMVLKGYLKSNILNTYQIERKPVAIATCRNSDTYFKLVASGNFFLRLFRNYLLPALIKLFFKLMTVRKFSESIFNKISGLSISYPNDFLSLPASDGIFKTAPIPGNRIPFFTFIENDGEVVSIDRKIQGDRFHLLIFGGNKSSVDKITKTAKEFGNRISFQVIPLNPDTDELFLKFGIKSQGWYLIRPDHYIACRSDESGSEKLKACLNYLFMYN